MTLKNAALLALIGMALLTLLLLAAAFAAASNHGAIKVLIGFFLAQWDTFAYWLTGLFW